MTASPTPLRRGPGRPPKFDPTPITPLVPERPDPAPAPTVPLSDRHCMTIQEASAYIGLSDTVITQELKAGRLVAKRYGRKPLVLRESLESYVASLPDYA